MRLADSVRCVRVAEECIIRFIRGYHYEGNGDLSVRKEKTLGFLKRMLEWRKKEPGSQLSGTRPHLLVLVAPEWWSTAM